jgi:uncharacterized protein
VEAKVDISNEKVKIEYPCSWGYTLITELEDAPHHHITHIVQKEYTLSHSKKSGGGKYNSFKLELLVFSEDERVYIFEELKKIEHFKYVL